MISCKILLKFAFISIDPFFKVLPFDLLLVELHSHNSIDLLPEVQLQCLVAPHDIDLNRLHLPGLGQLYLWIFLHEGHSASFV